MIDQTKIRYQALDALIVLEDPLLAWSIARTDPFIQNNRPLPKPSVRTAKEALDWIALAIPPSNEAMENVRIIRNALKIERGTHND